MKKLLLFVTALFFTLNMYAQSTGIHYVKFLHVGEQIMPVHPMYITFEPGKIARDSAELINDSVRVVSVSTDERSFNVLAAFIKTASFKMKKKAAVKLDFGTFKIIRDDVRFYITGYGVTDYFKKMIKDLKAKKADPQLVQAILDNYPWIFNP